jgi:hypothetical protein
MQIHDQDYELTAIALNLNSTCFFLFRGSNVLFKIHSYQSLRPCRLSPLFVFSALLFRHWALLSTFGYSNTACCPLPFAPLPKMQKSVTFLLAFSGLKGLI